MQLKDFFTDRINELITELNMLQSSPTSNEIKRRIEITQNTLELNVKILGRIK